jgi:hypothetical protein
MFKWPVRCAQSRTERISSSAVMRLGGFTTRHPGSLLPVILF